jgi:hypothetical protein
MQRDVSWSTGPHVLNDSQPRSGGAFLSLLEDFDDLDHLVIWPKQDCSMCITYPTGCRAVNVLPLQQLGAIPIVVRRGRWPELCYRVFLRRDAWLQLPDGVRIEPAALLEGAAGDE